MNQTTQFSNFFKRQKPIIMTIKHFFSALLLIFTIAPAIAQNTECSGTLTANDPVDGGTPFVNGYNYSFTTSGDVVTATFELLDAQVGLVGFAQTLNPDFAESPPSFPGPSDQIVSFDFPGFTDGETFTCRIKFAYAGGASTGEYLTYTVGEDCGVVAPDPLELPIDFENSNVDYTFINFGGNGGGPGSIASVIPNPDQSGINTSATVAEFLKDVGEPFAGSLLELPAPIDFSVNKEFRVNVWSPRVGATCLLKVENAGNPGIFFEQTAVSTVANEWEELSFDYNGINDAESYSKIIFIFDNGVVGDGTANFTWYVDDIRLVEGEAPPQIDLPIDFEDATADYGLTDFGGNASSLVADPEDAGNTVVQSIRTANALVFAGTTVGQPLGFENPIPFDFDNTGMSVRVWTPAAGTPVRLKVEQVGNPGIFVETEVLSTVANGWQTLEFDFTQAIAGGLDLNQDYNLASIFFNFGLENGPEEIYYWDDVQFAPGVGGFTPIALPLTFDEMDVTLGLGDFGGNASSIIPDPEDAGNNVVQSIRTANALLFAGTVVPTQGMTEAIPFADGELKMNVRVWSPAPGVPVRMKVENNSNGGIFSETETLTSTSGEWETIVFDFATPVVGAPPIDLNQEYGKVVMFFNFGLENGPEEIYLWDDVAFGDGTGGETPCELPYPEVTGQSFANQNPGVLLTWDPIIGSLGCQVQIRLPGVGSETVQVIENDLSSFFIPGSFLDSGTTYEWRVRCGCSLNPPIGGPWTPYQPFLYLNFLQDEPSTSVEAYPNPSTGVTFISINTTENNDQGLVEVYDLSGRLVEQVYSGAVSANQEMRFEFNGSNLPEGIYLMRYTSSTEVVTEKFMITR